MVFLLKKLRTFIYFLLAFTHTLDFYLYIADLYSEIKLFEFKFYIYITQLKVVIFLLEQHGSQEM